METLSFTFGMLTIVAIVTIIVVVVGVVEVVKLKRETENINLAMDNIYRHIESESSILRNKIEKSEQIASTNINDTYRYIDSRYDTLESKFKQEIKEVVDLVEENRKDTERFITSTNIDSLIDTLETKLTKKQNTKNINN